MLATGSSTEPIDDEESNKYEQWSVQLQGRMCWMQDCSDSGVFPYPRQAEPAGRDLPPQSFQEKTSLGFCFVLFFFQEKDVTPDKNLLSKVRDAALWLETSDTRPAKPLHSTTASIADFFLALTICNSVMVSTTTEPRKRVRWSDD